MHKNFIPLLLCSILMYVYIHIICHVISLIWIPVSLIFTSTLTHSEFESSALKIITLYIGSYTGITNQLLVHM